MSLRKSLLCFGCAFLILVNTEGYAESDLNDSQSTSFDDRTNIDQPSLSDTSTVKKLLAGLPNRKKQEFIGRPWEWLDSAWELGKSQALHMTSLLALTCAGAVAIRHAPSWLGNYSPMLTVFGLQTLVDYASSNNNTDLYFRAGANGLNHYINSQDASTLWRKMILFGIGHLHLFYQYTPEIYQQFFRGRHEGAKKIHFMSADLERLVELEVVAPHIVSDSVHLAMYFDTTFDTAVSDEIETMENSLEQSWALLAKNCRDNEVTSIRVRPGRDIKNNMAIQLWRGEKLINDVSLAIDIEGDAPLVWVTDWIAMKTLPQESRSNSEILINPLSEEVLNVINDLVDKGVERTISSACTQKRATSPKGRMAVFSSGDYGYLFLDRNRTADVELPELWVNTRQAFSGDMGLALASLESQQGSGHWRGIYGFGAGIAKSLASRIVLQAGIKLLTGLKPSAAILNANPERRNVPTPPGGRIDLNAVPNAGNEGALMPIDETVVMRPVNGWLRDPEIEQMLTGSIFKVPGWALDKMVNRAQAVSLVSSIKADSAGANIHLKPFLENMPRMSQSSFP